MKINNFLDIGGGAQADKVATALRLILADPNVKAVLFNIFGGITRCDDVARGLISALDQIKTDVPIVVRLSGTNAKEGLEILSSTGLPTVSTMSEAARKAIELSTKSIMDQKLNYLHKNPVAAGFVSRPEDWIWSSARDYAGEQGILDI